MKEVLIMLDSYVRVINLCYAKSEKGRYKVLNEIYFKIQSVVNCIICF